MKSKAGFVLGIIGGIFAIIESIIAFIIPIALKKIVLPISSGLEGGIDYGTGGVPGFALGEQIGVGSKIGFSNFQFFSIIVLAIFLLVVGVFMIISSGWMLREQKTRRGGKSLIITSLIGIGISTTIIILLFKIMIDIMTSSAGFDIPIVTLLSKQMLVSIPLILISRWHFVLGIIGGVLGIKASKKVSQLSH
tara:strand:+ start:3209 stop:3787 length:579 start_codon:yes stop_codon:yes gene_type:complete